jgi:hypothetical protein
MGTRGPKPWSPDWKEFDRLVSYQCTQEEIADHFDVSVDTLDNACQRDRGTKLSEVWNKKKNLGRVKLKKIQFSLAEQGSAAMAIFLGKYLLGQKDQYDDLDKALLTAGISREQAIQLILNNQEIAKERGKKTFEEFCEAAGYPKPFPQQIEMKDFAMNVTDPRMILGARGYGKTDYAVILGTAYDIYLHPLESTNLIITKSKDRSAAIIKEIQSAAEKNGVLFGKANSTSIRIPGLVGKDPSCAAVTIRTASFRGRHPKRIILDDPVTEDDTSEATRSLVKKKWNEINKLSQNVLVIGQPAHKFDLYADLRAIKTFKRKEYAFGSIPQLDIDIEALKLAGVSESSVRMSYFLEVPSEGSTPFDNIRYLEKFPTSETAVAWIDPSHEGGDFTSLTIAHAYGEGLAVVGFVWKKAWNHCLDELVPQLKRFKVRKVAFEANALGDQPVIMLRDLLKNTAVGVVGIKSLTNKHAKIMSAGAYAHLIHLSRESHDAYINQVIHYEYGVKNDDAPDGLASLLKWIGLIR